MNKVIYALLFLLTPFLLRAQSGNSFGMYHPQDTVGKQDLVGLFKNTFNVTPNPLKAQPEKSVYFSFLPTSSAVPGGGRALITTTTAGFYMGERENTNISTVTFTPYFNFTGRFGIPLRSNVWLSDNKWFIQGDTRFLVYPQYTWGLGGNPAQDHKMMVEYKYIRVYQSLLKRITPYFYAGLGYNMDYHIQIEAEGHSDAAANLHQFSGYPFGTGSQNTLSSGVSLNLLYDTRNNSLNPLPGCYSNIVYRYNSPVLGGNTRWQSLYVDMRKYIPFTHDNQQNMLALWSYYWTTLDKGVPYLDLPSIGWDFYNRSGRGIQQNRYRGEALAYLEAEYRRDITRNGLVGFVLFANATSVSEANSRQFKYIHPAGGAGLRLKFNKGSNTNIAIDYALSRGNSGFIVGLGEAF
ncbi:BamA/TamA family outer membrane protein [Mucilaginibacter sp. KACC 22063]|uniref:BamA/TamA family outer membrane protein n=1 Tax=Mucilaginibacter sp. KACC 22063 TaxID=3025666 RepID=UPI0023659D04|nr:BamA/TamA family outer membrane protein [Mucilaginibacter sp. KACC 22063]WDF54504.1 BamA/TamA family outer membrane protein [Mucilaginibacter sp. KACC 22063]